MNKEENTQEEIKVNAETPKADTPKAKVEKKIYQMEFKTFQVFKGTHYHPRQVIDINEDEKNRLEKKENAKDKWTFTEKKKYQLSHNVEIKRKK